MCGTAIGRIQEEAERAKRILRERMLFFTSHSIQHVETQPKVKSPPFYTYVS